MRKEKYRNVRWISKKRVERGQTDMELKEREGRD